LATGVDPGFTLFIIAGLLLALIGDINNIDMMDERTVLVGLVIGTVMLYLGDLEFGVHRFKKPIPMTFGPFLYAGGQLVISLSPSYFPAP